MTAPDQRSAPPYRAGNGAGRYAPSPTSDLHLGNLRTALLAWLFARSSERKFLLRIEDLDQARVAAAPAVADRQLADLADLGLDHDGPVLRQSERSEQYAQMVERVETYECFCSRRDIAEASQAPHGSDLHRSDLHGDHRPYPGTCRELTRAERDQRRRLRPAAFRVKVPVGTTETIQDQLHGPVTGAVDDFVVRRNDLTWAYNLAVVVDDLLSGVDQVVRGDDLLASSPRQAWLNRKLGGDQIVYAHVPLAVNRTGARLAKRDGAVTMRDLALAPREVLGLLAESSGLAAAGEPVDTELLLQRFRPTDLPRGPWLVETN